MLCLNRLPQHSVKHELGVGWDKTGKKPDSKGGTISAEDKVQDRMEGVDEKGGTHEKGIEEEKVEKMGG